MQLRDGSPQDAGCAPDRVQHVRELCAQWTTDNLTPALIALVARRGVIVLHEAWGTQHPAPDTTPLPRDAVFGIASTSKIFTATAAMRLVEDGVIGLDRPVQHYVPDFQGHGKERVMVRHLLTHTSGLYDEDVRALWNVLEDHITLPPCPDTQHPEMHDNVFYVCRTPLRHPPGETMQYSNHGYQLLGEVVRQASGQTFNDLTRHQLFEPLGMRDTYFSSPEAHRARAVHHFPQRGWDPLSVPEPSGAAHTTAMDLAIFGQMLLNGGTYGETRVLSPATVAAMTRIQTTGIPYPLPDGTHGPAWGLGFSFFQASTIPRRAALWSPQAYCHAGASGTMWWVDPVYELVGVFLGVKPDYHSVVHPDDLFINAVTACVVDEPQSVMPV
ncbi:MAG: beta-lactamase family protein [Chloroflexi bacterium]|nr:beta-lactamase family protein [Chloroflexota bacterium]